MSARHDNAPGVVKPRGRPASYSEDTMPDLAPPWSAAERARQRSHDAFVKLDEELTRENRPPDCRCPEEITLSERLAVRILVKHFGWYVTEPGTLRRRPTA